MEERTQRLGIDIDVRGRITVVSLSGELDLSFAEHLEAEIRRLEGKTPHTLALDLSALSFLDSSGLAVVLRAHQRAVADGRRLVVVPGPPTIQKVFAITGLDTVIEFAPEGLAKLADEPDVA